MDFLRTRGRGFAVAETDIHIGSEDHAKGPHHVPAQLREIQAGVDWPASDRRLRRGSKQPSNATKGG
jgi:hypothetical protein